MAGRRVARASRWRGMCSCDRGVVSVQGHDMVGTSGLHVLMSHITRPWVPGAKDNIILNPDDDSKFKYIEINKEDIRLEFEDTESPVYQFYTSHWTERAESMYEMEYTSERMLAVVRRGEGVKDLRETIKDVRNNTFCGAGASVLLCKEGVVAFLKERGLIPEQSNTIPA
ncbi:hypothetical protein AAMO2058_000387500 [Amorphochlora amoebiformis]